MKVVFVSRSKTGKPLPFVEEQATALTKHHPVEIEHFLIRHGGVSGYFTSIIQLSKFLRKRDFSIVHLHYGLWSFIAIIGSLLSGKKHKKIITFHGSDLNKSNERKVSFLASRFSNENIVVSPKLKQFINRCHIIPCGIETDIEPYDRKLLRLEKGWSDNNFIVLFSSSFNKDVKDPEFALAVIEKLKSQVTREVYFIELKGYNRKQLTQLMQAADALLMCSKTEGSPQVIKEAILNGLPVVSNDVGDVKEICSGADNCFIVEKNVDDFVQCLQSIAANRLRVTNKKYLLQTFDNKIISDKIFKLYSHP